MIPAAEKQIIGEHLDLVVAPEKTANRPLVPLSVFCARNIPFHRFQTQRSRLKLDEKVLQLARTLICCVPAPRLVAGVSKQIVATD